MNLFAKKCMKRKPEEQVQLVFDHWVEHTRYVQSRNPAPTYKEIKEKVRENGLTVNKISRRMECDHFEPLTAKECLEAPSSEDSDNNSDSSEE